MPWNRSKPEEHGHALLGELHDHVEQFHAGLGELEERLLHRSGIVEDRLASLESEHATMADALAHIKALRHEHRGQSR